MPTPYLLIVLVQALTLGETCRSVITVKENREVTGNDCLKNRSNNDYTCTTLQSALNLDILGNSSCNVKINIPPGKHAVTERVDIMAASVDITGSNAQDTFVQCYFSSSEHMLNYTILFSSCASVKVSKLTMQDCSVPIGFDTVSKVHIENTRVRNFTDAALEIYNCKDVLILDSLFVNNSGRGTVKVPFRGNTGAVSIGYYEFSTTVQQCTDNDILNITVLNSTFRDNCANADGVNHRSTSHAFFRGILTGRAGGLGVFINESNCNSSITVSDCTFEGNFARSFGGGLYYVYSGRNTNLRLAQFKGYVLNSTFIRNSAGFGAGGFITTIESAGPKHSPHLVYVEGCKFYENIANIAGGLYYYVVYQGGSGSSLIVNGTEFAYNSGNNSTTGFGSALVASIYDNFNPTEGFPLHEITNCVFTNNYESTTAVSIGYIPFSIYGHNTFSNNIGTALMIVGAQLSMSGDIKFTDNTAGADGGALKLISYAQIKLHKNTTITFTENEGRIGASIVVGPFNQAEVFKRLQNNPQCFILKNETGVWDKDDNINLIFEQNEAYFGSAIYVQSHLSQCSWIRNVDFDISYFPNWPIFELQNNNNTGVSNNTSEIYSITTDALSIETNLSNMTAWPGKNIGVTISSMDQLGRATGTSLRMKPLVHKGENHAQVHLSPNAFYEDKEPFRTNFKFSVLNKTHVNKNQTISVLPLGATVLQKVHKVNVSFQVEDCPAGYSLSPISDGNNATNKRYHCICATQMEEILQCQEDQLIIQNGLWAINADLGGELYLQFIPCPPGYCNTSHMHGFNQSDRDQQCANGRKGILCGECEDGYLRTVLTDQCRPHSSCLPKPSLYLMFLPLTVLFVAVIVIIVLIDKPLPAWIHPLLFYVQMFPLVTHFFPDHFRHHGKYLYYASSLLGFYLPYDGCIQGLNANGILIHSLRLALPLFSMVIGLTTSILIKYLCCKSQRLQDYFGSLKMHGVYTLLLLIFPNTLFNALRSFKCPTIGKTSVRHFKQHRWYLNGSIECFHGYHVIPVFLSVAILLIYVSPVFLLTIRMKRELPRWAEKLLDACSHHYVATFSYWCLIDALSKTLLIVLLVFLPRNELALLLNVYVIIGISSYISPYKTRLANHFQMTVLSLCAFMLSFQTVWNSGDIFLNTLVSMLIVAYYVPLVLVLLGLLREVLMYTRILPKLIQKFERMKQHHEGYRRMNTINGARCSTSVNEIGKTQVSVDYGSINITS